MFLFKNRTNHLLHNFKTSNIFITSRTKLFKMRSQELSKRDFIKLCLLSILIGGITGYIYTLLLINKNIFINLRHKLMVNVHYDEKKETFLMDTSRETYLEYIDSFPRLQNLSVKIDDDIIDETDPGIKDCYIDATSSLLYGAVRIRREPVKNVNELIEKELSFVEKGGKWKPTQCIQNKKVAIVIPFRKRYEHLLIFLRHMHPILKRQLLSYQIFVVNQTDDYAFNRGKLMNVGFAEAMKKAAFNCFVFHDVDLLPMNDRNLYNCDVSPKHMSALVDKLGFVVLYEKLFGGVEALSTAHYDAVNGFSNAFWGWGAEDDNLYTRINENKLHLWRPSQKLGKYTMLGHTDKSKLPSVQKRKDMKEMEKWTRDDGLSSLQYDLKSVTEHRLYTGIDVDLKKERDYRFLGRDVTAV